MIFHLLYSFDAACYVDYIYLPSQIAISNGVILGVTGDDAGNYTKQTKEVKKTPQGVAEWTPDDIFQTFVARESSLCGLQCLLMVAIVDVLDLFYEFYVGL